MRDQAVCMGTMGEKEREDDDLQRYVYLEVVKKNMTTDGSWVKEDR